MAYPTFLDAVLRYGHILFGILWIGLLYYFNLVQVKSFKAFDAKTKAVVIPELANRALLYFRMAANLTLLFGILLYLTVYHGFFAWDAGRSIHDFSQAWVIVLGMLLGVIMWFNVQFIIWPNQKKIIAAQRAFAKDNTPVPGDAAKWGKTALMASRFNAWASLPMLLFMVFGAHCPGFSC